MFFPDDPAAGRFSRGPVTDRWARLGSQELEAMIRRERAAAIAAGFRRAFAAVMRGLRLLQHPRAGSSAAEYPAAPARWLVDSLGGGAERPRAANAPRASRDVA